MAWFLRHPDGSKLGPFASEKEANSYMGENASFDEVVEEQPWSLINATIGLFMRLATGCEYGKKGK